MKTHQDLDVWKKSILLVTSVYELTKVFPNDELFGLVNQMRRCAVSIPSNIAEGAGRDSSKEFARYLSITLGSLAELETQLIISRNLNYGTESRIESIMNDLIIVRKMTIGLKKSLRL
jgi:four helix bundle protein